MVTTQPTCTEPGEEVAVCVKDSSHRYIKVINPLGHSFDQTWSRNAEKHWKVCSACGEKTEEAVHTFDQGTVTKAATETETGIKTFTCTVCGQQKTETIPTVPKSYDPGTGAGQDTTQPDTDSGTGSGKDSGTDSPTKKEPDADRKDREKDREKRKA